MFFEVHSTRGVLVLCLVIACYDAAGINMKLRSSKDCELPSNLEAAKFCPSIDENCGREGNGTSPYLEPGTVVNEYRSVRVECDTGYILDDQWRDNVRCLDGKWIFEFPRCVRPPVGCELPSGMEKLKFCLWHRNSNGKLSENCSYVKSGTVVVNSDFVTVECEPKYRLDDVQKISLYCSNGRWMGDFPSCLRDTAITRPSKAQQESTSSDGELSGNVIV